MFVCVPAVPRVSHGVEGALLRMFTCMRGTLTTPS